MRSIEILVMLANLVLCLFIGVPWAARWRGYGILLALFLVIVQVFVEGPRWQIAPVYILTGLLLLI